MELATKQFKVIYDDEFEVWRRQLILSEEDPPSLNPVKYWQLRAKRNPVSKFAINIVTILAAAANFERQMQRVRQKVKDATTPDESGVNRSATKFEKLEAN
jgi:hypothetical protein